MRRVVAAVALAVVAACTPRPQSFGPCSVTEGGEQLQAESLGPIAQTIKFFLDVDAGGPLTCRPGEGDACDPCVGAVVSLPIGAQSTVAIEMVSESGFGVVVAEVVAVAPDHETEVAVLETPTNDETTILVGITPTSTATVAAEIRVTTSADNQRADDGTDGAYPITIQYKGE